MEEKEEDRELESEKKGMKKGRIYFTRELDCALLRAVVATDPLSCGRGNVTNRWKVVENEFNNEHKQLLPKHVKYNTLNKRCTKILKEWRDMTPEEKDKVEFDLGN